MRKPEDFAQVEGDIAETYQLKTSSREDSKALLQAYFDLLISSMCSVEAGFNKKMDGPANEPVFNGAFLSDSMAKSGPSHWSIEEVDARNTIKL